MKKIFLGLLVIILLAVTAIYILVPSQINISRSVKVNCTKNGANKILSNHTKWPEWWPGNKPGDFTFNGDSYIPDLPANNSYHILIHRENDSFNSTLNIITAEKDSVLLLWNGTIITSNNPLKRFNQYQAAHDLGNNIDSILIRLKKFLEQTQNIYDIQISNGRVKDTLLMSIKNIIDHKPTTEDIYMLVHKLKNAITAGGAQATNYPMLNITHTDSNHFLVHVAIPVDKPIKETNDIHIKRMVPGNILITNDITGGNSAIDKAFEKMQTYVTDYNKITPAIPFQSLITDRMQQPDTNKWVTRIYYPVY